MTFFPPGAEEFNVPVSWSRSRQRKAGNPFNDQMFSVLLSSNNNLPGSFAVGAPTLQVRARGRRGGEQPGPRGGGGTHGAAAADAQPRQRRPPNAPAPPAQHTPYPPAPIPPSRPPPNRSSPSTRC
jgi:hypothetical protein